ncbi:capsule biosynthesis protein [Paracoccus pacificus]|uniref:Capsule biosynthesis protein n=2 Tax=Paracoccus pacificus TaxID=1463598 RepID=A0ABW4R8H9_9RHOB
MPQNPPGRPAPQPPEARPAAVTPVQVPLRPGTPAPSDQAPQNIRAPAGVARPRWRHWMLVISFLLLVVLPVLASAVYLWTRAVDQYVSSTAFSVRKEESQASLDILGGITKLTGSGSASDADILFEFIRSQDMVQRLDTKMNLRKMFSANWPRDFVFAYDPSGTIEDLTEYWQRQVKVSNDSSSGILTLDVSAFSPEDAHALAVAIFAESTQMINKLSEAAREDATRFTRQELEKTRDDLTQARQDITAFKMRTQIADPAADLAAQMGVLTQLQTQLAEALVAHDLLLENARENDPRVIQSKQRIAAIESRIEIERKKFGPDGEGPGGQSYSTLMAEYEKLSVDREFAEGAYRAARVSHEAAVAEARRQSLYLAAHIEPTMPESSRKPDRPMLLLIISILALLSWGTLILIYYSVRDRR